MAQKQPHQFLGEVRSLLWHGAITGAACVVLAFVSALQSTPAFASDIVMEEFAVPSDTAGISLYVRNKHVREKQSFAPEKIVLFVHGATYPASTTFDLPLGGMSWMDYIAERGYDVYLIDIRGYGRSSRPPEMDQPPAANAPLVDTATAVRDFGMAAEFIKKRRDVSKLTLLAWSWGTSVAGAYVAEHNDGVAKLILYAPQWIYTAPASTAAPATLGAYRGVPMDSARDRWLSAVPPDMKAGLIPAGWFEQWASATWATDPSSSQTNPPILRAPNGASADLRNYWAAGKTFYDPARIAVPTMIIHAEWDNDSQTYWKKLTAAPYKRYVQIGEGTHFVLMERNRLHLFREVQSFLDGAY